MTGSKGLIAGLGFVAGALALTPTLAAQTDPASMPTTNPQNMPGSAGSQTTPGVRRGTASGDPDGSLGGGAGTDAQNMRDKIFLRKAAQGGLAEVQLGQLAAQKATSEDVKKFGQRMVDDHTMVNNAMKPIAESMGLRLPTKISKMDQAEYDKLNGMSGAEFDKEYLAYMTADHHKDLKDFQDEANSAADPTLKDEVAQGLRIIARHTRMVEKLDAQNGVPVLPGK